MQQHLKTVTTDHSLTAFNWGRKKAASNSGRARSLTDRSGVHEGRKQMGQCVGAGISIETVLLFKCTVFWVLFLYLVFWFLFVVVIGGGVFCFGVLFYNKHYYEGAILRALLERGLCSCGRILSTTLDTVGKSTWVGRAICNYKKYRQAGEGQSRCLAMMAHSLQHTLHVSAKGKALSATILSTSPPEYKTWTHTHPKNPFH